MVALAAAEGYTLLKTVPVPGDGGSGNLFVNLEDKDEVLKIDGKKMEVLARWKIDLGKEPSGMAMDTKKNRLLVGCGN